MHVYTNMATKRISTTREAYDGLRARKGRDESFTDVRELATGHDLLPFGEADAREAGPLSGRLSRSGRMMGTVDVQVAGMAKAREQTLLATDRRFRELSKEIHVEPYP